MSDEKSGEKAGTYEDQVWPRLAGLLRTTEEAAAVLECREIAEQEAALCLLVDRLFELELSVGDLARAELAAMASLWSVWDTLGEDIVALPGAQGTLRMFWNLEPVDGRDGMALVPWMQCVGCGRILALEHRHESWGALSFSPVSYVVSVPDGEGTQYVYDAEGPDAVWRALERLTATCRDAA
ncbi:hypothetical protein [Streptomyces sp. NPDC046909]|uniref:hypothetical protein n=1 Tax=Streptomyces sp. NPDC046909 TaxID=3155617 RepID=UPI00340F36C6